MLTWLIQFTLAFYFLFQYFFGGSLIVLLWHSHLECLVTGWMNEWSFSSFYFNINVKLWSGIFRTQVTTNLIIPSKVLITLPAAPNCVWARRVSKTNCWLKFSEGIIIVYDWLASRNLNFIQIVNKYTLSTLKIVIKPLNVMPSMIDDTATFFFHHFVCSCMYRTWFLIQFKRTHTQDIHT